jgi:plasmid maintenance system antidote protein VapI
MNVHRGKILRQVIEKEKIEKAPLARKLGISRGTLYNWFDEKDLSWDHIIRIGQTISHDFKADFPELADLSSTFSVEESHTTYGMKTLDECRAQYAVLHDKYLRALESNFQLNKENQKLRSA